MEKNRHYLVKSLKRQGSINTGHELIYRYLN